MQLIDTHCHLNFDSYDADRDSVIQRAKESGVSRIIIPAVDIPSIYASLELAAKFHGIYVAVGIHPNSTADFVEQDLAELESLASESSVIAIGEIGLDYYWDKSPKQIQVQAFKAQLELAASLRLPVIIHNREASNDVMDILESWVATESSATLVDHPGVLHSFSASQEIAQRAINAGFLLGFTGPLTFKKSHELRAIARSTPIDRILVETDGPFLTPEPHRGKRNEPAYVRYVVERLAGLKSYPDEQIAEITTENAKSLFQI